MTTRIDESLLTLARFRIGGEAFALPVSAVASIAGFPEGDRIITHIGEPNYFMGFYRSLTGLIPLIDLRVMREAPIAMTYRTALVVLRPQPHAIAVVVDELLASRVAGPSEILPPERFQLQDKLTQASSGVLLEGWAITYLLALKRLLDTVARDATEQAGQHCEIKALHDHFEHVDGGF